MWTKAFWKDAIERAIKSGAQFALGYLGATAVTDLQSDWSAGLVAVGIGVGLSVVMSLLSTLSGSSTSASLVE